MLMSTPATKQRVPLDTPTKVYQDNFTPAQGNALQAAVASMFGLKLKDVPNFIESPQGYRSAICQFYQQQFQSEGCEGCASVEMKASKNDTNGKWSYKEAEVRYPRTSDDTMFAEEKVVNYTKEAAEQIDDKYITGVDEVYQGYIDAIPKEPSHFPSRFDNKTCILRGKSPRGSHGHVVVARHLTNGKFEMLSDPHPDQTFLDKTEAPKWCLFFEEDGHVSILS